MGTSIGSSSGDKKRHKDRDVEVERTAKLKPSIPKQYLLGERGKEEEKEGKEGKVVLKSWKRITFNYERPREQVEERNSSKLKRKKEQNGE